MVVVAIHDAASHRVGTQRLGSNTGVGEKHIARRPHYGANWFGGSRLTRPKTATQVGEKTRSRRRLFAERPAAPFAALVEAPDAITQAARTHETPIESGAGPVDRVHFVQLVKISEIF